MSKKALTAAIFATCVMGATVASAHSGSNRTQDQYAGLVTPPVATPDHAGGKGRNDRAAPQLPSLFGARPVAPASAGGPGTTPPPK